jgi:hypothetical protein
MYQPRRLVIDRHTFQRKGILICQKWRSEPSNEHTGSEAKYRDFTIEVNTPRNLHFGVTFIKYDNINFIL